MGPHRESIPQTSSGHCLWGSGPVAQFFFSTVSRRASKIACQRPFLPSGRSAGRPRPVGCVLFTEAPWEVRLRGAGVGDLERDAGKRRLSSALRPGPGGVPESSGWRRLYCSPVRSWRSRRRETSKVGVKQGWKRPSGKDAASPNLLVISATQVSTFPNSWGRRDAVGFYVIGDPAEADLLGLVGMVLPAAGRLDAT